jgi:hypothetical protein
MLSLRAFKERAAIHVLAFNLEFGLLRRHGACSEKVVAIPSLNDGKLENFL